MQVDYTLLLTITGALVLCTNIVTEVLKGLIKAIPAQITATAVALVLTLSAGGAYASINAIQIEWYMVIGAVVLAFFVSYGAQFGFDKLKEVIKSFKR